METEIKKRPKDMTPEEYTVYERERQRAKRAAKKAGTVTYIRVPKKIREEQNIPKKEYVPKVKEFKPIDKKMLRSQLTLKEGDTTKSIDQYLDRINVIYKNLFNTTLQSDNFNLLDRSEEIIAYLEDKYEPKEGKDTKETIRTYINSIIAILNRVGYPEMANKYKSKSDELNALYAEVVKKNVKSKSEEDNWVSWNKILKDTGDNFEMLTDTQKLIAILYTTLPSPRRIEDYRSMEIVWNKVRQKIPKATIEKCKDKTKNYIIISDYLVHGFIFNVYKTSKTYGTIYLCDDKFRENFGLNKNDKNVFDLNMNVKELLRPLVRDRRSGFLLLNENGNQFSQPDLSKAVQETFLLLTGKMNLGCNMLRKIYITDQIVNNPRLSIEVREDIGRFMGHSVKTQETYNRVIEGLNKGDLEVIRTMHFGLGDDE
jgi:hypothetical protein